VREKWRHTVMFCHQCGQKLPDEARFCFKCGRATVTDIPAETPQQDNGGPKQALALPLSSLAPRITPFPPEEQTYNGEAIPIGEPVIDAEIEERVDRASQELPGYTARPFDFFRDTIIPDDLERVHKILKNNKPGAFSPWGDLREALRLCESALRFDPRNSEVYLAQGQVLVESNRYEEALVAFNHAIRLGSMPTSPFNVKARALEHKGRTLYLMHRHTEALAALEASLAIVAKFSLADTPKILKKLQEARIQRRDAIDLR
jgi:tetratricopeptide (TPR) repeat protein